MPTPGSIRAFIAALLILGILLLTIASLLPTTVRIRIGTASYDRRPTQIVAARRHHRFAHWIAFGGLSFVLALLGRRLIQRFSALVGVVALGVLLEELQHLIYRGRLETWDIRDDTYAALAGFLGATIILAVNQTRDITQRRVE